jgi:hypothetical protein
VKAPAGAGVTLRVTGVLIAQLPPTGVMVVVPEATPVITPRAFTVAIAGLELVRDVGLTLQPNVCVVEPPTGIELEKRAKVQLGGGLFTVTVRGVLIRQLSPIGVTVAVPWAIAIRLVPETVRTELLEDI